MKFKNRILSLVLVFGMILPNLALAVQAEEPENDPIPDTTIVIWEVGSNEEPVPEEKADMIPDSDIILIHVSFDKVLLNSAHIGFQILKIFFDIRKNK